MLPAGAPEPRAPPCIRQRPLPDTFGDLQNVPDLVIAPHFGEASIDAVLRECDFSFVMGRQSYTFHPVSYTHLTLPTICSV